MKPLAVAAPVSPRSVKPGRDEQRVHQRYLRMSKEALVKRLITAERTVAEQRERWLLQQDEALIWRLRAEAAEARLKVFNELVTFRGEKQSWLERDIGMSNDLYTVLFTRIREKCQQQHWFGSDYENPFTQPEWMGGERAGWR